MRRRDDCWWISTSPVTVVAAEMTSDWELRNRRRMRDYYSVEPGDRWAYRARGIDPLVEVDVLKIEHLKAHVDAAR